MKTEFIALACLLLASASLLGTQDDMAWMRGANYVPSYAKNSIQIWREFDPVVIDRELGYAERLKLNTVRIFCNVAAFEKQPKEFLSAFENFLVLADKHRIKVMPVLFDSCFDPQVVDGNKYRGKTWIPSPGFPRLGDKDWPAMENFIRAVVGKYRNDPRIVLWDVMNEPESTGKWGQAQGRDAIVKFVRRALERVRQEKPVQPMGIGWATSKNIPLAADLCDVLIIHNYMPVDGLAADIRQIKDMGRSMNKPVIINEFLARPKQRVEKTLPVIAKEGIGWCFWELMIGDTEFARDREPYHGVPYQGKIYPDGACFLPGEIAAILHPDGFSGNATALAKAAGFVVSHKVPKTFVDNPDAMEVPQPFSEESVTFSPLWTRTDGGGPTGGRLRFWSGNTTGETAAKEVTGTSIAVVFNHGPDCGIASVTIDGKPAGIAEIDTCSKEIGWDQMTVVAKDLPPGSHSVVVTVTGRKADAAKDSLVKFVDIIGAETGTLNPVSGIRLEKDVAYLPPDRNEKADLYLPSQFEPGKTYPGIVIIHGGAWYFGDKGSHHLQNIGVTLASHGYVCMSVNYQLASKDMAAFPQNIQDCKRAVRWLRKNAARFQLDAARIGVIGESAGGHLAALLAVSGPDTGIDPQEDADFSCRVQAAVPMYPHCASYWESGVGHKRIVHTKLDMFAKPQTEAPKLWDSASPIKQLSKDDPPMLILHGNADKITPLDQSTRLHEAARKMGIPCELIILEDAPHGFHLQPKQRDLRTDVIAFFDKYLKGNLAP